MTKLSRKKINWLVNQVIRHGKKPSAVAPVYGITPRRVRQLVRQYRSTGMMPVPNPRRRPATVLTEDQTRAIETAFEQTRLSARLLYYELKRRGTPVPKNKIYAHLKQNGRVRPNPRKQKQRKRCRYEREHSGSLVHGDVHRTSENHPYCFAWLDDASRKILAGGEFEHKLEEHSIRTLQQAVQHARHWNVQIRQVNIDHGAEFGAHREGGTSPFLQLLEKLGIELVLSRVKNPQTNGKLERLWCEYDRHRSRFPSFEAWAHWYNNRLHGALKLEWAETPEEAFRRKMRPEELVGLFFRNERGFK
jgi:putative transposase